MSDAIGAPCRTPGPAASHPGHRHCPRCQHPGGILLSPPRIYHAPWGRADPTQPGSCPQPVPPAQRLPRGTGNCRADSALSRLSHRPPEPAGASPKETKQHFGEKNLIAAPSRAWVGAAGPGASEELAGSWQAAHGVTQPQPPPTNHNKTRQYTGLWVLTPRSCLANFNFHSDVCVEQQRSETEQSQEAGTQPSDPSPPVPGAAAPIWSR